MYTTVELVKALSQVKYADLGFSDENSYNNFINELIGYASSLIDDYCNQSFMEPPLTVSYATALIVTNMLNEMLQRKINPIATPTNITVKIVESEAFTEKIKRLLDPYRVLRVEKG